MKNMNDDADREGAPGFEQDEGGLAVLAAAD